MPEANYDDVVSEIKKLNLSDQIRLLEQIATIIRNRASAGRTRSILELKGKGKNIWKGLDVKAYLDKERLSRNG